MKKLVIVSLIFIASCAHQATPRYVSVDRVRGPTYFYDDEVYFSGGHWYDRHYHREVRIVTPYERNEWRAHKHNPRYRNRYHTYGRDYDHDGYHDYHLHRDQPIPNGIARPSSGPDGRIISNRDGGFVSHGGASFGHGGRH